LIEFLAHGALVAAMASAEHQAGRGPDMALALFRPPHDLGVLVADSRLAVSQGRLPAPPRILLCANIDSPIGRNKRVQVVCTLHARYREWCDAVTKLTLDDSVEASK
jgi:hypothetical protein